MCTVLVTYDVNNEIAQSLMYQLSQTKGVEIADNTTSINKERKRIPVSEIYFKEGDYKELVDDPFNLKS